MTALLNESGEPLTRPGYCAVQGCQEKAAPGSIKCAEFHKEVA